ncbi:endo-1,4-beta-xylanase [Cellvibrio sp. NN19]|uniref:endo-1,4-beta-xylanase n=1 Tax=Cellvibrio chitinivorans TaxID=3102792 RepID=UPI002B40F71E|nr:endo-1,4-beta-xylanase [Cellvibrio sp. NN19]
MNLSFNNLLFNKSPFNKLLSAAMILGAIFFAQASLAQSANCSYSISNEWNTGATGAITITNTSTAAINGWTVGWQYATNRLSGSWNANVSGSNPYSASNLSWNAAIQPGQSVSFGFQIDKRGGSAERPVITGNICGGVASSVASSVAISSSSIYSVASSTPSSVSSSSSSISVSSSVASSVAVGQQCNWYGTLYPLCVTTQSGWGYENNKSCISRATCTSQPAPYGVVGASSSSSPISSSSSSVVTTSSSSLSSASSSSVSSVDGLSLKALADFPIGVAVRAGSETDSILNSSQQKAVLTQHFDQLTAENIMKMSYVHPSETTFSFANADALIEFARQNGASVHGHALIWHEDYQVPSFMKNYTGDFSAMLKTHVQTVAAHFSGKVVSWDVVNEAIAENSDGSAVNGFRNSVFYQKMGVNFIDQAFIWADEADPVADHYYNDFNTETNDAKTTRLLALIDGMKSRGVPIDGVGFQMHVLPDWPSIANIEASFRAVAQRGLKVKITELDVRVNNKYNSSAPVYTSLTPAAAVTQSERYRQIVAAYLRAVPAVQRGGITVWGMWDAQSWFAKDPDWPLLFDNSFQAKPALQGFANGLTGQ